MKKSKIDTTKLGMLAVMLFGYVLLHTLFGGTLFSYNAWDSYTMQALAWRRGSFALGQDYPWLELAVYQGDWYVSFPPIPTLVMLPLTYLFGENVPSNFVVMMYALISAAIAYGMFRRAGAKDLTAAFMAVFTVWGSNMMWMSTVGGVWFLAQGLNLLLCLGTVACAQRGKKTAAYTLLALAVGCRPFSILYFPVLLIYFAAKAGREHFFRNILCQWKALIPAAVIGGLYMAYNYARFGNVLEFGHNYLPEFTESEFGQFHISYLGTNLYNLFLRPMTFNAAGALEYPTFDGFLFYLANPIFLVLAGFAAKDLVKKRMNLPKIAILAAFLLHILLLCLHKTLGGWQFGARYTVDLIPFVLLYLCMDGFRGKRWIYWIGTFGILFNVYGAVAMHFLHG